MWARLALAAYTRALKGPMMQKLVRFVGGVGVVLVVAGCAMGPADRNAQPTAAQRVKILSQNANGIVITHSEWGKPIAFRMAEDHCVSLNKVASYRGGTMQLGPDMASSWYCE
jgi:hypothetical protein